MLGFRGRHQLYFELCDIIMKPIFSGNSDYNKSAFVNWRTTRHDNIQNMLVLAKGFLLSSIELAKTSLSNNSDKKADILIFPILANANHGIELYLKAFVWTLNKLLRSQYNIEGRHNIKQILDTVQAKLTEYKDKDALNYFNNHCKELLNYIDELYIKIQAIPKQDKMDFSRYPIDDKYKNHFYIDELENVEVDLENFISRFQIILDTLDEIVSYFLDQELNQNG
jgi:hypothetical protein